MVLVAQRIAEAEPALGPRRRIAMIRRAGLLWGLALALATVAWSGAWLGGDPARGRGAAGL